ncbi:thiolase family protein [Streptomyces sp. NPDC055078]
MNVREAVIVDAVRTPVGKRGGRLAHTHPTDLLAHTLRHLVERSGVDPERLADVIAGCAMQVGEQTGNLARFATLGAGLPQSLPATTIDRQCGSGQQAVHFAAQGVRSGEYDFAIGAGVESMSRVDLGPLFDPSRGKAPFYGETAMARYEGNLCAQGPSAELVVTKWGLTRAELDEFSAESHRRAHAATEAGYFSDHLVPIGGMTRDEGIRAAVDPAKMAALQPAFGAGGAITAGNASQISDGAAALLIADRSAAEAAGLRPKAVIRSMAVAADDPVLQFTAVIPAARKALDQVGLSIADMDRIEVNEAFAPVPLIFAREFGIGTDRLNVNGGSIAIGHPLGSTGARLLTDLVYELARCGGRYGLLTICEAGGMANATIIERVD